MGQAIELVCDRCNVEAQVMRVKLYKVTGMFILWQLRTFEPLVCRTCGNHLAAECLLHNLFLGWWGLISFFANIALSIANLVAAYNTSRLRPPPPGAGPVQLSVPELERLKEQLDYIQQELNAPQASAEQVAYGLAQRSGVRPGQAMLYLRLLLQASSQRA